MAHRRGTQLIKLLMNWGLPLALLVLGLALLPSSNTNTTVPQTNTSAPQTKIDPTAFYYALSTIGQVAAALAALIGFLGQWWLTRLRDEETRIEQKLRDLVLQDSSLVPPQDLPRLTRPVLLQIVERVSKAPQGLSQVFMMTTLRFEHARLKALPGEQKRLLKIFRIYLRGTLVVMVLAIMGFVFIEALLASPWMPWILRGFIVVASLWLGLGPAYLASVMWKEVPISWEALVLVLLLLMSPALAGPVRCTTYEEKTLGRLQTLCDDGTRAVSTYNKTLGRWDTTITHSPRQTYTGQPNPRTQQVEVRCR